MIGQSVGPSKCSRTVLTNVRPFLSVRAHVHFQIGVGGEWTRADLADVRFDAVVRAQVSNQSRRLGEALGTNFAKKTLRAVGFFVLLE